MLNVFVPGTERVHSACQAGVAAKSSMASHRRHSPDMVAVYGVQNLNLRQTVSRQAWITEASKERFISKPVTPICITVILSFLRSLFFFFVRHAKSDGPLSTLPQTPKMDGDRVLDGGENPIHWKVLEPPSVTRTLKRLTLPISSPTNPRAHGCWRRARLCNLRCGGGKGKDAMQGHYHGGGGEQGFHDRVSLGSFVFHRKDPFSLLDSNRWGFGEDSLKKHIRTRLGRSWIQSMLYRRRRGEAARRPSPHSAKRLGLCSRWFSRLHGRRLQNDGQAAADLLVATLATSSSFPAPVPALIALGLWRVFRGMWAA